MSEKQLHILFMTFFLAISIFLTLGRVGTAFDSFALLTPDLGVYASLAAAQDQPQLFANDPFLSNEKNTNSYNMVFVPLVKALKQVFGNYGTACAFLLPFFIFIHLTGYYVLGVSIFKNPWMGLLVSLLVSAPVSTYYDFWGLILDALPRFLYQGLIPFLLALTIVRGKDPKWWTVIMAGLGLLNYIHPLSTPVWTIAIMLGLWVSASGVKFWEKVGMMGLATVVLVVTLTPFLMNYVGSTVAEAGSAANYDQTLAILQARFSTMSTTSLLDILSNFFRGKQGLAFDIIWYLVCAFAAAGMIYGLIIRTPSNENTGMRQITAWMAGVFLGGGVLPVLEQAVFAYLKRIPPEFELTRTFRYMIPLILLAAFGALWTAKSHLQRKNMLGQSRLRNLFVAAGIFLLIAWGLRGESQRREFREAVQQNLTCWSQARLVCPLPQASMDFIGVLDSVREKTPTGARIFSEGEEVAVRYYALRPLVYTYKDGAPLAYTDQKQLLVWSKQHEVMDELAYIKKFPFRRKGFIRGIVELAISANAEFLVLSESYDPGLYYPENLNLVYTNESYSLYQITR